MDALKAWGVDRNDWEIILAPNPGGDETERVAHMLAENSFGSIRTAVCRRAGKGAALAAAFHESKGRVLFFSDSDQPYDLSFFSQAFRLMHARSRGPEPLEFVSGNRRLPESEFQLPMSVLPYTFFRHCLGVSFNALVRGVFGIRSRDTQAGAKVLSRRLAEVFFAVERCPTFFFDIELFLVSQRNGFRWVELPVTLRLLKDDSSVRFIRESVEAIRWLYRIKRNQLRGVYRSQSTPAVLDFDPSPQLHSSPGVLDAHASSVSSVMMDVLSARPPEVSP